MIKNLPYVKFSHIYSTTKYDISFVPEDDIIEITYVEKGNVIREMNDGKKVTVPSGNISIFFHDKKIRFWGEGFHSHSTILINVKYDRELIERSELLADLEQFFKYSESDDFIAILPDYLPLDGEKNEIEALIKKIVLINSIGGAFKNISISSLVMNLFHLISIEAINNILAKKDGMLLPSNIYYCNSAMNYIAQNISSPISIIDIAQELGISENYLCNVFKSVMGITIIKYINDKKIKLAKELIENHNISRKEICRNIGISEENYLSRLFKNNTGMSISEYKRMKRLKG